MRGVTLRFIYLRIQEAKFQLTRLMRGVTSLFLMYFRKVSISTHTPHARRDIRILLRLRIF